MSGTPAQSRGRLTGVTFNDHLTSLRVKLRWISLEIDKLGHNLQSVSITTFTLKKKVDMLVIASDGTVLQ